MITNREPIGRLIVLANIQKDIVSKSNIDHDIENLIDIIKIRSRNRKIGDFSETILSDIFDLRIELIEWLVDNDKSVLDYLESINQSIADSLQLAAHSELSNTIAKVLSNYEKVATPIIEKLGIDFEETFEIIKDNKPNYESIKLLSLIPSPPMKFLKRWIDASLKLEVGLIVADLVLTGQISFSVRRINEELIPFMIDSITQYGAYAKVLDLWHPSEVDYTPITNRMEILASTVELDHGMHAKISGEYLFALINN